MKRNNIYINDKIPPEELFAKLKDKYTMRIIHDTNNIAGGIYITDTDADCLENSKIFDKIFVIDNSQSADTVYYCYIICPDVNSVINYLLLVDYDLGLTYLLDGNSGMRKLELHKKLRSWTILYSAKPTIDYVYQGPRANGRYSRDLYNTKSILRNIVDIDSINHITDKDKLYEAMKTAHRDYLTFMPKTEKLETVHNIPKDNILIVKPVGPGAHSGKGIIIVTNGSELDKAKNIAKQNKKWKWIVSTYIINPLLFRGMKFHFRCYLMVTSTNKFYKFNIYEILTARDKYKTGDYSNKYIHDTHGSTTMHLYYYPKDMTEPEIATGVNKIMDKIITVFKSDMYGTVRSYPDSKYGYDILGIDIIFDDNYNPWLIEVNTKIGQGASYAYSEYVEFENAFLDWEYNCIVKPTFNKIVLVSVAKMTSVMIGQLLELTTDSDIMDNIGRGELWDRDKIEQLIDYEKKESGLALTEKKYMSWVACLKYGIGKVVGFLSLRPMFRARNLNVGDSDLQIRIFTYPSQGYGSNIIKKLMSMTIDIKKQIWATVHSSNAVSIKFFTKLGWTNMGSITVGKESNVAFLYNKKN